MNFTSTGFPIFCFTAAEAKPLIRLWLDDVLLTNGYIVKKTTIHKLYPDFKVTWRINAPAQTEYKKDRVLEGVRITFVVEKWMPEICRILQLPEFVGDTYDETKKFFLSRWDFDSETNLGKTWDVFSTEELESTRPSLERGVQKIFAMFEKMADPIADFDQCFALSQGRPHPLANRHDRIISLYRIALHEGINGGRFPNGIHLWHEHLRKKWVQLKLQLSSPPPILPPGVKMVPPPSVKSMRKHGMSEAMIARILDPLRNYDVIVEQDNDMFRSLARALREPEDIWTMKNPRTEA